MICETLGKAVQDIGAFFHFMQEEPPPSEEIVSPEKSATISVSQIMFIET